MRRHRHEEAILALLLLTAGALIGEQPRPTCAPMNPEFAQRLARSPENSASVRPLGLIPRPVELPRPSSSRSVQVVYLPGSYDLRATGKLTPVKDQGPCGSCWAFATYGSLESWLMPDEAWDYSENNLINTHGFDYGPCVGGNDFMSMAYLGRWSGPVAEADDPYDLQPSSAGLAVRKHVQGATIIPERESALDNADLKLAVMAYGGVYTTMYWNEGYYAPMTAAYCCGGSASGNHAVCIVGWNDAYSRMNFAQTPPGDGAFIVRNSWGPLFGDGGYFYVSYYDAVIGRVNCAFNDAEETDNYGKVFQYDPFGWVMSVGYPGHTTAWGANVFEADSQACITAVGLYAAEPNSPYEISIYLNPMQGPLSSGDPATTQSGVASCGYQTVPLDRPVQSPAGQRFSVVLKMTTAGYEYPIATEDRVSGYTSRAAANPGESFISLDGESWDDVTDYWRNMNVCLKAFTSPKEQTATPTFDPDGGIYYSTVYVSIGCSTTGAVIRYTTDGSDPDEKSPLYSAPVRIVGEMTLKARAWKAGLTPSSMRSAKYTVIAHTPANESLAPGTGWIYPERKMTFTCTYSDAAGISDIARCYLLLNGGTGTSNAPHVKYDFAENKLYVRNDADTSWLGGYAPGSAKTIENGHCRLYCAETSIAASGNKLAVSWKLLVKSKVSGSSTKAWMKVFDKSNQRAGWETMGRFSIARPPRNESLSPSSGAFSCGREYTFTSKYSDANGAGDIAWCTLLISPNTGDPKMLHAKYDAQANRVYLWDTGSRKWIGGYAPGKNVAIENAYSRLHCEGTSASRSGNALSVRWRIEMKKPMSGKTCGEWLTVTDAEGMAAGMEKKGGVTTK